MVRSSSISWLDFADNDRRKMMEVVSLFKVRETRDELGVGSIRNAFANHFFPGTSTLQTRARYFLFAPWLYRYYEERKVLSADIERRLKYDEVNLIQALTDAGETDGVIGARAGASLQRFPSSVYWNGLQRWGILRFPGVQYQYHRSLDGFYAMNSTPAAGDDSEQSPRALRVNWDPNLPKLAGKLPEQVSFALEPEEADYLRERLLFDCSNSLLAFLVDRTEPADGIPLPWMHPQWAELSDIHREHLDQAHNFSLAIHGSALLYNLMLAELIDNEELVEVYQAALNDWEDRLKRRSDALLEWDRREFWRLAASLGNIPARTRQFVNRWLDVVDRILGNSVGGTDRKARNLIERRELQLKGTRSRLRSERHRELWTGASGTWQIDFRWASANRIILDIQRGLEGG